MKKIVFALFALIATITASDVIDGTESNFDELTSTGFSLVEFFAPWCGHCKKLAPEWEEAATALKGQANLIKVDATVEQDLAGKFNIQGYPTIKVFRDGEVFDYEGGRTAPDIIAYVTKRLAPAVEIVRTKESLEELKKESILFVLYTTDESGAALKTFQSLADAYRDDYRFAAVVMSDQFGEHKEGDVVLFKHFEAKGAFVKFTTHKLDSENESETRQAFHEWVKHEAFPLVDEIGPENYKRYVERGLPLAWLFIQSGSEEAGKALVLEAATAHRGELSFVYLDGIRYSQMLTRYGFSAEPTFPLFVIETASEFWAFPESSTLTSASLVEFCAQQKAGTLPRTILSEAIPEQATENGLTTLVGKTAAEIALHPDMDVLIEFYAPWCGHCKNLAPIYAQVAKDLEAVETLVIAKMDATLNEVPSAFQVEGFPTLYFKPAGKEPFKYKGERTADAILAFIAKHATHPVGKGAVAEEL